MFIRINLGFLVRRMVLTVQDALDVSIHVEATCVLDLIPFKIYAGKFGAFPILGNGVM